MHTLARPIDLLALHEASVALAALRDPGAVLEELLWRAGDLLGAGSGTVYTWDAAAGLLRCAHNWQTPAADTTPDQRPGEGLAGRAFVHRQTLIINDYPSWDYAMASGLTAGLRAALAVPLSRAGTLLGVVVMRSYDEHLRFTKDDARLLELFADQAAITLENALLHDRARGELAERRRVEAALRESEEQFRSAFEHAAIGMALVGLDGRWLRVNGALSGIVGYTAAELLAIDFQAITHPDDLAADLHLVEQLLAGLIADYQMEKRYRHRSGRYVWVLLSVSLLRDAGGRPVHFISQVQDIDDRKLAEEALRSSETRYRALLAAAERQAQELRLLDQVRTALARELDPAAVFRVVVEAVAATFGYTQVSLYLRGGEEHVLQHQVGYDRVLTRIPATAGISGRAVRERRALLLDDVAADSTFLGAIDGITSEICVPLYDAGVPAGFLNVESTGNVRLTEADLHLLEALGEQVGIAIERARLHGALREREGRLAHLAAHDALTGLPNRRYFGEALGAALARQRRGGPPLALLYLDLDGFKAINDAFGHESGDVVLGEVAERLRAVVRAGDTPVRLGGDEFAVLLEGAGVAEMRSVATRIAAALAAPVQLAATLASITVSIGGAMGITGETADDLLRRGDALLYAAKRAGKNRVCLDVE